MTCLSICDVIKLHDGDDYVGINVFVDGNRKRNCDKWRTCVRWLPSASGKASML